MGFFDDTWHKAKQAFDDVVEGLTHDGVKLKPVQPQASKHTNGGAIASGGAGGSTVPNLTIVQVDQGQPHHEPPRAVVRDERGVVVHSSPIPPTLPYIHQMAQEGPVHRTLRLLLSTVKDAFGYVVWNYQDFFHQLVQWDGSWQGLFVHTNLMMRTMVTVILTYGIFKTGEIVSMLSQIVSEVWTIVTSSMGVAGNILNDIGLVLQTIWEDIMSTIRRITG